MCGGVYGVALWLLMAYLNFNIMDKIAKSIVEEFIQACEGLGETVFNKDYPYLRAFLLSNINRSTQILESFLALNEINTN